MKALESTHILTKLIHSKRERLQKAKMRVPEAIVKQMAKVAPVVPSLKSALESSQKVRIIAELKKASPSKGVLANHLNPVDLAQHYKNAGASAISVVTEEDHFQGDLAWVGQARKAATLPVLRKDFVYDPYQIYETRGAGASAILLIAAMLQPEELRALYLTARETGLEVLVEVHDETELGEALAAGADIIGVNNRDLKTFRVELETSLRLARQIPDDKLFVVESGIDSKDSISRLMDAGADAFLIGEYFLTAADPEAALRGLL
jgi:indole-3-glycerol phosphate synthase